MNWEWVADHTGLFGELLGEHVYLSVLPVVYGLLISVPLGVACVHWPRLYPPVLTATSILYALPSIALFVFLLNYTGLSAATVIIPLTIYTLSALVPNVVDGLRSVPESVRQSAVAMGFGPVRQLVQIELPIAVPVVIAGVRIATVSNISLVSVGSLVGIGGLGRLFIDGFQRSFSTPILAGIILTVGLAVVADGLLVLAQRLLTPWGARMRILELTWHWFLQPEQWTGVDGIPTRLGQHLYYTVLALLIATAVAVPLGLLIGHTNRGGFLVVNSANAARALPTVGVLVLVVTLVGIGLLPALAALIVLAVPPILVNTYAGIRQVEPEIVDASRGMGMRGTEVLRLAELPIALPLILLGVRTAAIQIVSTATIAAYVGLGGLGRYIFDGLARRDSPSFVGGAVMVVLLALAAQAAFVPLQKLLVSAGVRRR